MANNSSQPKKTVNMSTDTASTGSGEMKNSTSEGLGKLFTDQLKDIYWAEKALVKAIPKMIKKATNEELIDALEGHLSVTEGQVTRAEEVFKSIGVEPVTKVCPAMKGLIEEAEEIMKEMEDPLVRDAGIIAAAQKVEHYEIASYGTLRAHALALGFDEAADLLGETLEEEKEADDMLTEIAEEHINSDAVMSA